MPLHSTTSTPPPEEWRPVVGFEGLYEVSNLGNVKRLGGTPYCKQDRLITPNKWGSKYLMIQLWSRGQCHAASLHQLLAKAFIGLPPTPQHQVNHIDGDKRHNALCNLEWVTPSDNLQHARDNGMRLKAGRMSFSCERCGGGFTRDRAESQKVFRKGLAIRWCSRQCWALRMVPV